MSETTTRLADVQFPRSGEQKTVLWMDSTQIWGAAGCLLGFLTVLIVSGSAGPIFGTWVLSIIAMIGFLVGAVVIIVPWAGRPVPWWIRQWVRSRIRRFQGQHEYVAAAASEREDLADAAVEEAAVTAGVEKPVRLRLPGEGAELLLYELPRGGSLVWDPALRIATMTARVHQVGFVMAEPEDKGDVLTNWSSTLDALYTEPGVIAVQGSDTITTASSAEIRAAYERQVAAAQEAGVGAGAQLSPLLHTDYLDLLTGDRAQVQHANTVAVTVSQPMLRDQIKSNGGGIAGLLAVCGRLTERFEAQLMECSVEVESWMSPDELAAVVRTAFLPDDAVAVMDGRVTVTARTAGPMAVQEDWALLRCDGAWHRVLEIAQWPTSPTQPGFMKWLNGCGEFPHVVTQIIKPLGVAAGMKKAQAGRSDQRSAAIIRAAMGQEASLVNDAVSSDWERTGQEVLAGHGLAQFMGLIVVSGGSADELETNTRRMVSGATRAGCEIRTLYGQQWPGFLAAALPLGRGLIKAR